MSVVVAYDIDFGWNEVKNQAYALGFYNILNTTTGERVLPNTTLFIENYTALQALERFDQAVANASQAIGKTILVEKVFSGVVGDWWIRSDESS